MGRFDHKFLQSFRGQYAPHPNGGVILNTIIVGATIPLTPEHPNYDAAEANEFIEQTVDWAKANGCPAVIFEES